MPSEPSKPLLRREPRQKAGEPRRAQHTVLAGWAQLYILFGLKHGIAPPELCAAAGISPADVADRDRQIPRSWAIAIQSALHARLPGIALGLELGKFATVEHLGYLGYALKSCPNGLEALQLLTRCARLVDGAYREARARLVETAETVAFRACAIEHDPPDSIEMGFVNIVQMMRSLTGQAAPREVRFAHRRHASVRAPLAQFFGCPVHFGCEEHALVIERASLVSPLPDSDAHAMRHFGAEVGRQLEQVDDPASSVVRAIRARLGRAQVSQADVARSLGMSTRALQRALQQHGLTYKELLARARKSQANRLLADRKLAVYEVALALGYDDVRAFNRAFRQWTGTTPSAYRAATAQRGSGS